MRTSWPARSLFALVLLGAAAVACGGEDDDDADVATPSVTATRAASATARPTETEAASPTAVATDTPAPQPTATSPAPAATQPPAPPPAGPVSLRLTAANLAFNTAALSAPAGATVDVTLDNTDQGIPHNVHFFRGPQPGGESLGMTPIAQGPVVQTVSLGALAAGDYAYRCDVHSQTMLGVLQVR